MATNCDACGCRTNEVKSGGGIEDTGCRMEVKVTSTADLKRDVLKVNIN
jgi:zinc finger protein